MPMSTTTSSQDQWEVLENVGQRGYRPGHYLRIGQKSKVRGAQLGWLSGESADYLLSRGLERIRFLRNQATGQLAIQGTRDTGEDTVAIRYDSGVARGQPGAPRRVYVNRAINWLEQVGDPYGAFFKLTPREDWLFIGPIYDRRTGDPTRHADTSRRPEPASPDR